MQHHRQTIAGTSGMQPDGCREPTHHQREHHTDTANIMQPARRSKRMHLANYPTHHLGCRQSKADGMHTTDGTNGTSVPIPPDGCSQHRYCQHHAAPPIHHLEPETPTEVCRHTTSGASTITRAKLMGMQHHLGACQSLNNHQRDADTTRLLQAHLGACLHYFYTTLV